MKKTWVFLIGVLLVSSHIDAQSKQEKRQLKKEQIIKNYEATKELINNGIFEFVAIRANPQGGSAIDMITNPNNVTLKEGQSHIYLPYFGVVRSGGGYNTEAGIKYKGEVLDYEVEFDEKKHKILVKFRVKNKTEQHNFSMHIGSGGATTTIVSSTGKSVISYFGKTALPKEQGN